MSKIIIDRHAIAKIKDAALRVFHETRHLPEDSKDTQVFLVLNGFSKYLMSLGIEPNFEMKPAKEEPGDATPLDDL